MMRLDFNGSSEERGSNVLLLKLQRIIEIHCDPAAEHQAWPQGLECYHFLQWGAILRLSVQAIRAEAPRRLPVPGCSSPLQGEELQRNKGVT
ncbi:hypothetical protein SRHO_G00156520 [Serrasalmus rhombeus]